MIILDPVQFLENCPLNSGMFDDVRVGIIGRFDGVSLLSQYRDLGSGEFQQNFPARDKKRRNRLNTNSLSDSNYHFLILYTNTAIEQSYAIITVGIRDSDSCTIITCIYTTNTDHYTNIILVGGFNLSTKYQPSKNILEKHEITSQIRIYVIM